MARIFAGKRARQFSRIVHRFGRDRRANVAMIFALVSIPLLFAVGMGVDYAGNARKWTQMNAAADAAALTGASQQLLGKSDAVAATAAQDMFNAQIAGMSNLIFNPAADLNISIVDSVSNSGTARTATVNYTAKLVNNFAGILGQPTMSISGSSRAAGTQPLNINFYLLLDSSPSMGIAGTSDGIAAMVNRTLAQPPLGQGGCAFACHESNPPLCSTGNPDVCGNPKGARGTPYATGVDNFQLAKTYFNPPIVLRIDLVNAAVQALLHAAQQVEPSAQTNFQMSINTFDVAVHPIAAQNVGDLTADLGASFQQLTTNPIQQLEVYDDWRYTVNSSVANGDTDWDDAIAKMNAVMPDPGKGTNLPGDKPLEFLIVVTDGVQDIVVPAPVNHIPTLMSPATCAAIKNRKIQIAVLYTEYLPLPTNPYYNTDVAPFQSEIAPSLQQCASPGLFAVVTPDLDIPFALVALFQGILKRQSYLSQ